MAGRLPYEHELSRPSALQAQRAVWTWSVLDDGWVIDLMAPNAKTREQLYDFIGRLSIENRRKILDAFQQAPMEATGREREVVDAVITLLNRRRKHHAMRVWMGWLEPAMVHPPLMLRAHERLPLFLHRIDAMAWWRAVEPLLKPTAARVQAFVAERAKTAPVDDVLAGAEIAPLAEDLRRHSLTTLRTVNEDENRRSNFLAVANMHRKTVLDEQKLLWAPPLDERDLSALIATVSAAPTWRDELRGRDLAFPASTTRLLRVPDVPGRPVLALAHAYATLDPRLAAEQCRQRGAAAVLDGLTAGFVHLGHQLAERLAEIVPTRGGGLRPAAATAIDPVPLASAVERFFAWYDACLAGGGRERGAVETLKEAMLQLAHQVNVLLLPWLERLVIASVAHQDWGGPLEHLSTIAAVRSGLKRRAYGSQLKVWSPQCGSHIDRLFRNECARLQDADFITLATLALIADHLEAPVAITATSVNLVTVARLRAGIPKPLTDVESPLMQRIVAACGHSRATNGRWTPPEVIDLLDQLERNPLP